MILRLASMSIAVALAACSGGQDSTPTAPIGPGTHVVLQQASHQRNAGSEAVIYSFGSKTPDGTHPQTTLTDLHGTLYGETTGSTGGGNGTIFTVTPSGSETVLHIVTPRKGGQLNELTLGPKDTRVGRALYGTAGGAGEGTIVRVTRSGNVVVLHQFTGGADGADPGSGLVNVNGTFYGTTESGGEYNAGTVYSVTPSGTENVIYSFQGGAHDGEYPVSDLVNLNGTLYGTTEVGGSIDHGTVFSITPAGTETVLHSFQDDFQKGNRDGGYPEAGLTAVNGVLYGTTVEGGSHKCYAGCGTVFSITTSGTETIVHYFRGGRDGSYPSTTLLALNGKMYGTTYGGGGGPGYAGYGTVFSLTPSGTERRLHSFTGGSDGATPFGGLVNIHRTLYGTTDHGGTYNDGTVYSITL